jgi:transcriptional regulator with XRE-family HTH domain
VGSHLEQVMSYVGANVRRLREERGLTQDQLAEAVGVDIRTVQRIEAGMANVLLGTLVDLGDVLGVKPGALLKEAEMPEVKRGRPKRAKE